MIEWRIYYANGSTFSSDDGDPEAAPGIGVLVIVQWPEDPREKPYLQFRGDYYIWKEKRWYAVDLFALWQYIFIDKYHHEKVAISGEMVSNYVFEKIVIRAKNDQDFYK